MAISTIGNITYINQNMQATSANHANTMQRGDMIPQEFENKLKEIQEVRPTQTSNKVDKDAKGNQQWAQEESQNKPPKESNRESQEEANDSGNERAESSTHDTPPTSHLLNITV